MPAPEPLERAPEPARVVRIRAIRESGELEVDCAPPGDTGGAVNEAVPTAVAKLCWICGYQPRKGDLLAVIESDRGLLAIAVVESSGDVCVKSERGAVRIEAAADVQIVGARDVTVTAARRLEARGQETSLRAALIRLTARDLRSEAVTVETRARNVETVTDRMVTRARDVVLDAADRIETRARRARTLIEGAFSLRSQRTVLKSEEDTSIDGRRVLLG